MGGCESGTGTNENPDPAGTIYADVAVNSTFEHPNYCEYCTEGRANCGSNEFVSAGNGEGRCKCRGLCNDGCCKKLCKRISYLGDPTQCCIKSAKSFGSGKTCDPKYRSYATNDCDTAMNTFCSTGDNLFTNPNCVSWFNQRPQAATATLETACSAPANVTKPQCGCILARKEMLTKYTSGTKISVECIDNRCTNGGWKTFQMSQNPCNVVNCEMNISDLKLIANAPVGTYNASFVQQCKNEKDKLEAAATTPPPVTTGGTGTAGTSSTTDNSTVKIVVGGGFIVFVVLVMLFLFYKSRD
jgi:hypothetical protein